MVSFMLQMTKDRILLHSLLEEALRMDCKNFSGKGGCFLARKKGSKTKGKETKGQETQSTVLPENNKTCSTGH